MTALEICLIIIGLVTLGISYFISDKNAEEKLQKAAASLILSEETKKSIIEQTKDTIEETLNNMSDDITEKVEVALEKLSTEKIMAVHDYSNTVLEQIGKNHEEVMFLYSMLDDKDKEVRNTVKEVQKTVKTVDKKSDSQLSGLSERENSKSSHSRKGRKQSQVPQPMKPVQEDRKNEAIIKLYEKKRSILEIARELGVGVGEVRLVIDLYTTSGESKGQER